MKRRVKILIILVTLLVAALVILPRIFRETHVDFDGDITLDGQSAHVTITSSRNRYLLFIPHGPSIGGGDKRYSTSIRFPSGKRMTVNTDASPNVLWSSQGRLFLRCQEFIAEAVIGEITSGQFVPVAESSLPEPSPKWSFAYGARDTQTSTMPWPER
jgi:hypothetical protein